MILTASLERLEDLDVLARQLCADVVITSECDAFSKKMKDVLEASRPILFVIEADGRQVAQYALLLDQTTFENVSLSNLVDAVNAAAKEQNRRITKNSRKRDKEVNEKTHSVLTTMSSSGSMGALSVTGARHFRAAAVSGQHNNHAPHRLDGAG